MKFEKLNESNGKVSRVFLYGLITGVALLIVSNLFLTKAKYKVVDSAKLVNSTINYSSADLNVIAMYKNDGEKDELIKEVPKGYYDIDNERSYCKVPDSDNLIKDKITYDGREVNIKITQKGTKCYIYFIPAAANTLADLKLKSNTETDGCPTVDENGIATITGIEDTKKLICSSIDDYGETYYFRGQADNNWIKIGDTYWRIIRINGDGTIRLIYNGTNKEETAVIANVDFNEQSSDNKYVGFMFGKESPTTSYDTAHKNEEKSTILKTIENWYNNESTGQELKRYEQYLDGTTGFCNDRQINKNQSEWLTGDTKLGYDKNKTAYAPLNRFFDATGAQLLSSKPTFKCENKKRDLFTMSGNEQGYGNGALLYPIGLITADEVVYAGGYGMIQNNKYFLYSSQYYWTLSPNFYTEGSSVFVVHYKGNLRHSWVKAANNDIGVRPVINLKADTPFTNDGDGSKDKPFTVKLD